MADNFVVLSSEPSVDLIGLDNLVDVQRTTVMALPAGVSFPVSVPSAGEIAGPTGELAAAMADAFNQAAGADGVVGMAVTQDVDAAGNLIDIVIVTVVSSNGLITAEKTVPLAMFGRASLGAGVGGLGFSSAGGFGFDYVAAPATAAAARAAAASTSPGSRAPCQGGAATSTRSPTCSRGGSSRDSVSDPRACGARVAHGRRGVAEGLQLHVRAAVRRSWPRRRQGADPDDVSHLPAA
jgi:hypothetical protein